MTAARVLPTESVPAGALPNLDGPTRRSAALAVCARARDVHEARLICEALGLLQARPKPTPIQGRQRTEGITSRLRGLSASNQREPLTAADLDWMRERGYLREVQA